MTSIRRLESRNVRTQKGGQRINATLSCGHRRYFPQLTGMQKRSINLYQKDLLALRDAVSNRIHMSIDAMLSSDCYVVAAVRMVTHRLTFKPVQNLP